METTVRLPRQYDPDRLRADLDRALEKGEEHLNVADYHDGGWSALALHSLHGGTGPEALRWGGWGADYRPAPVLEHTPYFREVLDGLLCPKHRVRILRLAPGTKIHTHRDDGDGWAIRKVRLHIPIITNDDVHFYVDEKRVVMQPGELWYCDFTHPHRVHNASDVGRVHMVVDCAVNDWLRSLFPHESMGDRMRNAAQRAIYVARTRRYELTQRTGLASLKKRVTDALRH